MKGFLIVFDVVAAAGIAARAATTDWTRFSIEGGSAKSAEFATHAGLSDMLIDASPTGVFTPHSASAGASIVRSGAASLRPPAPLLAAVRLPGAAVAAMVGLGHPRGS